MMYLLHYLKNKEKLSTHMSRSVCRFREIWISNLPNDGSDMYMSVLTIERTNLLDSGQYTCQVVDWGVQQCKSIYIEIRDEPDVKVVPMSAIIDKVRLLDSLQTCEIEIPGERDQYCQTVVRRAAIFS